MPEATQSIATAAIGVLKTENADAKAKKARHVFKVWQQGSLAFIFDAEPPDRPQRPERPTLLPPGQMLKRRKAGSAANRIALMHAVAHIELNAIDLAFDIVARFGEGMPRAFTDDWLKVGDDEARHFDMIARRLENLGASYGDLPAHDGLWEAAEETAHDLMARLAIVPMVLEARGLDVTPAMIARFKRVGDAESAKVLDVIYREEIDHVAAGQRWFSHLCKQENKVEQSTFQSLVRHYFKGQLKPPFNKDARNKAGFPADWYQPLAEENGL